MKKHVTYEAWVTSPHNGEMPHKVTGFSLSDVKKRAVTVCSELWANKESVESRLSRFKANNKMALEGLISIGVVY